MSVNEKMTAIADAIRDKTKGTEPLTLDGMATEIPKVYEEGKTAEYDAFWDRYQRNGAKGLYQYAFAGFRWDDITFKPKYDIILAAGYSGTYLFYAAQMSNLKDTLIKYGVTLNTSEAGYMGNAFQSIVTTEIPIIDLSNASISTQYCFASKHIQRIDKVVFSDNTSIHSNMFSGATSLESVEFDGVISKNGFDVHWSTKLNTKSIVSIIEALSDETNGLSVTLSETAVGDMVFPFTSERTGITYNSWNELEATKPYWTITLKP